MTIHQALGPSGVLELVLDVPPVNALDITTLRDLVEILDGVAMRPEVHVVVLRSKGRGFVGGGDVKEVQQLPGNEGILGQANGSLAASVALHECAVPVIAAVHKYCIGLGVLLAGSCDIVLASEETIFVLAEVDAGAAGGAIQAIGLMPDMRLRTAMFTCEPVPAAELLGYGTLHSVVPGERLVDAARELAETIAAKQPAVVRASKQAINASIGRRIRELYRQELSYTFELNLTDVASAARDTVITGERGSYLAEPRSLQS